MIVGWAIARLSIPACSELSRSQASGIPFPLQSGLRPIATSQLSSSPSRLQSEPSHTSGRLFWLQSGSHSSRTPFWLQSVACVPTPKTVTWTSSTCQPRKSLAAPSIGSKPHVTRMVWPAKAERSIRRFSQSSWGRGETWSTSCAARWPDTNTSAASYGSDPSPS